MGHHPHSPRGAFSWRQFLSRGIFFLFFATILTTTGLWAQTAKPLVKRAVNPDEVTTLAHHHPQWATAANASTAVASDRRFEQMVVVLARPVEQEQALEALIARQQTPGSADYHHWLTPEQVGERFGPAQSDIDAVTNWLASQGLEIGTLSPSRTMLRFSGTAVNLKQAFGAELRNYSVNDMTRYAISGEPTIPAALAEAIKAVRGLVQPDERPQHVAKAQSLLSTELTTGAGSHYMTPADFNTIYTVPSAYTGAGYTIGIVSWARIDTADLTNFNARVGTSIAAPTVVIPTAKGGIDPGAACTSSTCSLDTTTQGGQMEATLDVLRAGSTAPGASLLLVASKYSATNGGIGEDTEYLVETSPVPAQVITISFGGCETSASSSDFTFWNNLFQTAATEGISVFVSSGDSGASGCETSGVAPTTSSATVSPNYICASQYTTCVGGTQFIDTTTPSTYWSSSNNSTTRQSAIGYIPEGAWNESTTSDVYGTGGGVSTLNTTTPSWQTGTGVPSAHAGRYTPDVSFSSAGHDGYFACLAMTGATCVADSSGSYYFTAFSGTSAAAPSMAGIAALLDQKLGATQGNLNSQLYSLASGTNTSAIFHDVTVSTSGVSSCSTATPSVCNNSIYSSAAGAVAAGYAVTAGYDEATGLGSLNVTNFLNDYGSSSTTSTPTVAVTPSATSITTAQSLTVAVAVSGSGTTPTGNVTLTSGNYTASATLSGGTATIAIPASTFSVGTVTLAASYTPDSTSASTYGAASGSTTVTVTALTPTVTVTPSATSITTAQSLTVAVAVSGSGTTPTGTVVLSGGGYTSSTTLSSGTASFSIASGALSTGTDTLTATYTPATSAYTAATGATTVTVTAVPTMTLSTASTLTVSKGATTGNTATITATPGGGFTGAVALTATITASPTGATSLPTLSLSSNTVTISGTTAQTATLTVTTAAATSAAAHASEHPWMHTGGVALAGLLLLLPWRRKSWRAFFGALLLCMALGNGLTACSSSKSSSGSTGSTGTTAGTYTITVAGTASGVTIASQTITLTVQ